LLLSFDDLCQPRERHRAIHEGFTADARFGRAGAD
jgi:hypothetical protein